MPAEIGVTLGPAALRQVQETVRRVLGGYRGTPGTFPIVRVPEDTIEFVLGETLDPCSDPLTGSSLQYARAYVYGRDENGDGVYLGQRYIWNRYNITGEEATFGTAEFKAGKWMAVTLNCDPTEGYEAPESLDDALPDRPEAA